MFHYLDEAVKLEVTAERFHEPCKGLTQIQKFQSSWTKLLSF